MYNKFLFLMYHCMVWITEELGKNSKVSQKVSRNSDKYNISNNRLPQKPYPIINFKPLSDQLIDYSINLASLTSYSRKTLASLCSWAGRFES